MTIATLKGYELVMIRFHVRDARMRRSCRQRDRVALLPTGYVAWRRVEKRGLRRTPSLKRRSTSRFGLVTPDVTASVTCLQLLTPARANRLIRRYGMRLASFTAMPTTTMLVRSGAGFKMVCSDCRKTIAKNLPNERAAYLNAGLAVRHQAECSGAKISWFRQSFATHGSRTH